MIHLTTGDLMLDDGTVLKRHADETTLLKQLRLRNLRLEEGIRHDEYASYSIRGAFINQRPAIVGVTFETGVLTSIDIVEDSSPDKGWGDWSEEKEHDRKRRHDEWLHQDLGPPPYDFEWGRIASFYDARTCNSVIPVRCN